MTTFASLFDTHWLLGNVGNETKRNEREPSNWNASFANGPGLERLQSALERVRLRQRPRPAHPAQPHLEA